MIQNHSISTPPPYHPADHYWHRADGSLYASARQRYVQADDEEYGAWRGRGGFATPFPRNADGAESESELAAVLAQYGLALFAGDFRVYLTKAGTYHRAGCSSTTAAGEWLSLEELPDRNPESRPCSRCKPPLLPCGGEGESDG